MLIGPDEDPVGAKTRKALAILGYLSRVSDLSASRESLADLLWSGAVRQKGMQSLRQALKQLKTAEEQAGLDAVISTAGHIQLDHRLLRTDLQHLLKNLNQGDSMGFEEARALWRGEFLAGFDDIDPQFTEWLLVERQRIRDEVFNAALKQLTSATIGSGAAHVEAAANFLLHIDPAFETAHRILIRFYLGQGQRERAEQQLKACERELKELDEVPEPETFDLLTVSPKPGVETASRDEDVPERSERQVRPGSGLSGLDLQVTDNVIHFPHVSIISAQIAPTGTSDAVYLKEEIIGGLSAYRAFDLYHGEYFGDAEGPQPTLIQGYEAGSYLLRFQHNERNGKVSVHFEDRAEGRIVFNEIVDLKEWDNVQIAASHTIGRIYNYVTSKLRNPQNGSAFARWCQAEALMIEFNPNSDRKALQILSDIERKHSSFSMAYSGRALINLKQLVYYLVDDKAPVLSLDEILSLSEHAVALDPWQPINQRAHGWALIQSNMADEARRAFLQAGRLNNVDPINLISVAEGLAFAGDVGRAREKAELAMDLFTTVPRVFYEYYSHVFFAAEDYDAAARMIERAAFDSISGLTTRIASLVCAGKEQEAIDLLKRNADIYANTILKNGYHQDGPNGWGYRLNFYSDPKIRANYEKGVNLVKRFFFGDRASVS